MKAEAAILSIMNPETVPPAGVSINKVLDEVSASDKDLASMDFEHLVEVYLRHSPSTFAIQGDVLTPIRPVTAGAPVTPPSVLYFGTTYDVANMSTERGLSSMRSSHVVLTEDYDVAVSRSMEFAAQSSTAPFLITVDAEQAHKQGVVFLGGDRAGLYKTPLIESCYLHISEVKQMLNMVR
jgi:hypothetical protein